MIDNQLLLNPKTRTAADAYISQSPQAIMIIGLPGSGKTALARAIASHALNSQDIQNHPYFLQIARPKGKKDIPIEDIRSLIHKLRLKTPGSGGVRRMVFIEDAQDLSTEAQNALLKALEEPSIDTAYMMSVTSNRSVLPTIASRTQVLTVLPVTLAEAKNFYSNKFSDKDIEAAWQLSQGRPGLMNALLNNADNHPLKLAVDSSKQLLRQDKYHRLLELDRISKDKEQFNLLLDALSKVLAVLQRTSSANRRLLNSRRLVAELQEALLANTSPRLVALELALKLDI